MSVSPKASKETTIEVGDLMVAVNGVSMLTLLPNMTLANWVSIYSASTHPRIITFYRSSALNKFPADDVFSFCLY